MSKEKSKYYIAGDYAGVRGGSMDFYYGYEEAIGFEDNEEWCFVAKKNGKEIMRIPEGKLRVPKGSDMAEYLLDGIAQWLEKETENG